MKFDTTSIIHQKHAKCSILVAVFRKILATYLNVMKSVKICVFQAIEILLSRARNHLTQFTDRVAIDRVAINNTIISINLLNHVACFGLAIASRKEEIFLITWRIVNGFVKRNGSKRFPVSLFHIGHSDIFNELII